MPRRSLVPAGVLAVAAMLTALACTAELGLDDDADIGTETDASPDAGSGSDSSQAAAGVDGPAVEVVRLSDGDSGWFLVDGDEVEVRLLGYNAPERYEGDGGPESCNGQAAKTALAQLLADATTVTLISDGGGEPEIDRFGRVLADLSIDGISAVDILVGDGRGLAIGDNRAGRDLMAEAAADGRGLWGGGCGAPAAVGLVVDRVEPDPPGRDEEDLNGEYVELVNRGSDPIDLDGWDIRDDSSSHRFDLAGVLDPGDRLVIRTGSGSSTDGELFLGSSSPVWSNRGDTVLVIDPAGVVVAWAFAN